MYITSADDSQFSSWFANVHNAKYPDSDLKDTSVKNITIIVTEDCNFACTYCYQHCKTSNMLSAKMATEIVDFILNEDLVNGYYTVEKSPCVILDFIGGEPLLNIDAIEAFMEYFVFRASQLNHPWAINYCISMSSNGSLYHTEKVQKFVAKYKGRCSIGITIDGSKELHDSCRVFKDGGGTYDIVEKNFLLRLSQGGHPSTKITIAPENLQYIHDAIIHLSSLGIKFLNANVVFENVWKQEHAVEFYQILKKLANTFLETELYRKCTTSLFEEQLGTPMLETDDRNWCGGDGSMLAIGVDGTCYPCLRYMKYCFSTKDREPIVVGNIYDGLKTPEQCEPLKCLTCLTRKSQSTDECFNCPIAQGCSW